MIYWGAFLPYFAFAAIVIGGMAYSNNWVIAFGLIFFFLYTPNPELKNHRRRERIDGNGK